MSYDKNECHISGKVEGFQVVATRTGTSMIKFRVLCNKERIAVVAFKGLADATLLTEGEAVLYHWRDPANELQGAGWRHEIRFSDHCQQDKR